MGNSADIDSHPRHIIRPEQLPGCIRIYNAVILHQVISRKVSAVEKRQRVEQKKVSADGIRRQRGLVGGYGHASVRAVSVRP